MANQMRMEDEDRISNLPDDILSRILSFLSTREAVGTSILSTRWSYLFALLTNFNFELDFFESKKKVLFHDREREHKTFKSFMSLLNRVLSFHNTRSIEKFRLKLHRGLYYSAVDSDHVYDWLSSAFWCGVQHLDLDIFICKFTLPATLFTSTTLVTLKLNLHCSVFDVPNDVCFPNLKALHLNFIEFLNDDSIKRLFSSCISLEDVIMDNCCLMNIRQLNISHPFLKRLTITRKYGCNYCLVISAPMLVHFKYVDYVAAGYSLKHLQSLISAEIDTDLRGNLQADVRPLFRGMPNVQSLNLSLTSLKLLLSCEPVPAFPNIVRLEISYPLLTKPPCFYGERGLGTLLRGLSELKELVLHQFVLYQHVCSYLPGEVPFCLSFKIKVIEISNFITTKECFENAKYFLKNAGVLEKLTIHTRSYIVGEREKLNIKEELLASPTKSKQCCILIV